jgi:hypothetical protein
MCIPVQAGKLAWEYWDNDHPGRCINVNAAVWANAAVSIVLDITSIILPSPELAKLHLSLRKKIYLCSMFSVGFLLVVQPFVERANVE